MLFWTLAALATLLATAAIMLPWLRTPRDGTQDLDYDREIYRARMSEIDRDLAVGRLSAEEADAARAEEGRRLLAVAPGEAASATVGPGSLRKALVAISIVFVTMGTFAFYLYWGNPGMPDMAIAERSDRDPGQQPIEQLLERAEARLAAQPDDLRGWMVVAPVYMRLGRPGDSVNAWRNAVRLAPENIDLKGSLAEAMIVRDQGVVTAAAQELLDQVLQARPRDAKARFYSAVALSQEGKDETAIDAWQALIGEAPDNAPWLPAARSQLAAVQERLGIEPKPPSDAPGPSREDIEAAGQMTEQDRQAMIETMVAGLAERLTQSPDDFDGWMRLIRSYSVLGDTDKARDAIEQARAQFSADQNRLQALAEAEAALGDEGSLQ